MWPCTHPISMCTLIASVCASKASSPALTLSTILPSELKDVKPPPPHKPCSLSSKSNKLFNDRSQPSVASFFKRKAPAQQDKGAQPNRNELVEQQEPQLQPNRQEGRAAAGHEAAEQEQPDLEGRQPCPSDRGQPDASTPAACASAGRQVDELARWVVHCPPRQRVLPCAHPTKHGAGSLPNLVYLSM